MQLKCICNLCEGEENVKKIGQFLGTNISRTAEAISFNFDIYSSVYVRQKIYKFGRNLLVVLKIQKAEFGKFTVPVNNTLVCHTSFVFLATETLLVS